MKNINSKKKKIKEKESFLGELFILLKTFNIYSSILCFHIQVFTKQHMEIKFQAMVPKKFKEKCKIKKQSE